MKYTFSLFLLGFFVFGACTSESEPKETQKPVKEMVEATLPELRNPSEMALRLKAIGAEYLPGMISDTSNLQMYHSSPAKSAVNMGVYFADLEYSLIYNDLEASRLSASAIEKLADNLGISAEFDSALVNSFDPSLTEEQRLLMLDEGLAKSRLEMGEKDGKKEAILIVSGYFTEQLYQLLQIVNNYPSEIEEEMRKKTMQVLYERIKEEERLVGNILEHVKDLSSWNPDYKNFVNDLERLQLALGKMKTADALSTMDSMAIQNDPDLINVRTITLKLRGFILQ
jgi:hypothetical protein